MLTFICSRHYWRTGSSPESVLPRMWKLFYRKGFVYEKRSFATEKTSIIA